MSANRYASAFDEIATLACVVRKGYPEAARHLQKWKAIEAAEYSRGKLAKAGAPKRGKGGKRTPVTALGVPDGHLTELRDYVRQSEKSCEGFLASLGRLGKLVFRHLPDIVRTKGGILDRTPERWHWQPVEEWESKLTAALLEAELAAYAVISSPETERTKRTVSKLFPMGEPENRRLVEFVQHLDASRHGERKDAEIAREFTGESKGNDPKAKALLALYRTSRHRGIIGI